MFYTVFSHLQEGIKVPLSYKKQTNQPLWVWYICSALPWGMQYLLITGYAPIIKHKSEPIRLCRAKLLIGLDKGLDLEG